MTNDTNDSDAGCVDQKQADLIGRLFNSVFNSTLLYGGSHRTTVSNTQPFFKNLAGILAQKKMLTFFSERDSLFVENCPVDRAFNSKRIVAYFKKAGMQSVSFVEGVRFEDLTALFSIIGDQCEAPSVQALVSRINSGHVQHVKINYVTYCKVTADEAIIDKEHMAPSAPGPRLPDASPGNVPKTEMEKALLELTPLLAKRLMSNPSAIMDDLINSQGQKEAHFDFSLVEQLKDLGTLMRNGDLSKHSASPQEIFEAVSKLKEDISRNIEILKTANKLEAVDNAVSDELSVLSRETIIRLIRDEYQSGAVSIKRLAQIVRRLLPDVKELKSILPFLKTALQSDGMSSADYLDLVNSLVRELSDEGLTQSLAGAAESMGLSVDEIVESIKSNPEDSARLIVLASEIRKGTSADPDRLPTILSDYVEHVGRAMHGDAKDKSGNQTIMRDFENQLLEKFRAQGIQTVVMDKVKKRLSHETQEPPLPRGVFDIKVTMFFLEHEIKRYLRYHSPFSTILLSIISLKDKEGAQSKGTPDETSRAMTHILLSLKKMLRDLDLIGVMLWVSENIPFIILPMTDQKGALAVNKRICDEINKTELLFDGKIKIPKVAVTASEFTGTKSSDSALFMKNLLAHHKEDRERKTNFIE